MDDMGSTVPNAALHDTMATMLTTVSIIASLCYPY